MERLELRLFIAGHTPEADRAIENLRDVCDSKPDVTYAVEVVDLLEDRTRGASEGIWATPALVRTLPAPVRRIFGDLDDRRRLLVALGLQAPAGGLAS